MLNRYYVVQTIIQDVFAETRVRPVESKISGQPAAKRRRGYINVSKLLNELQSQLSSNEEKEGMIVDDEIMITARGEREEGKSMRVKKMSVSP